MEEEERFTITVGEETLLVIPQYDESFVIMQGDRRLGVITPECIDHDLKWMSADVTPQDLVDKIGDAIECHDM